MIGDSTREPDLVRSLADFEERLYAQEHRAAGGSSDSLTGPVHISVKNTSGGTLTKGTAVYATGSVGASGAVEVQASDNTTPATMPALGLLDADLGNGDTGSATILGVIRMVDTSSYTINDELWINGSGTLQNTRPTSGLIQKIGRVVRVHATTGEILVLGAGRTNDVPFPLYVDHTNQRVGIGTTSPAEALDVNGNINIAGTARAIKFGRQDEGGPHGLEAHISSALEGALYYRTSPNSWSFEDGAGNKIAEFDTDDLSTSFDGGTLFVDATNNRVGIGNTTPSFSLDVAGDIRATGRVRTDLIGASGGDDLGIGAGETANYMSGNISGEHLWLGAEGNTYLVTSPDNWASGWAGRDQTALSPLTDGSLRVTSDSGYIDIGPKNATYCHIYTDRGSFYFNKSTLYANSTSNKIWHAGNDGAGSGLDADTLDGSHASSFINNSTTQSSQVYIRNGSPTLYLRDTSHRSAMIHCNSDILYFLRGSGDDSTTWEQYNSHWPLQLNLNNNAATFGGDIYMRAVNANRPGIYRVGGIYLTWDSDTYGTNAQHSIRSTDGDTWSDDITINSFGNIRMNIDTNNNGNNIFSLGRQTTGTGNNLFTINESGYMYLHLAMPGVSGYYTMRRRNSDGLVGYASSSLRYKENVADADEHWRNIYNLRPVTFDWRESMFETEPDGVPDDRSDFGLIAEEVAVHLPEVVTFQTVEGEGDDPVPDAVDYEKLSVFYLSALQDLEARVAALEN